MKNLETKINSEIESNLSLIKTLEGGKVDTSLIIAYQTATNFLYGVLEGVYHLDRFNTTELKMNIALTQLMLHIHETEEKGKQLDSRDLLERIIKIKNI